MYNHEPSDYKCPICIATKGAENDDTLIKQSDIVYKDDLVFAFISSFFIGNNSGHVIISPIKHFENIYDIPRECLFRISEVSQKVALLLKQEYKCTGITMLQNNEPDGGQHAFHYHYHVFPRYKDDELHAKMLDKKSTTERERLIFSDKLKGKL